MESNVVAFPKLGLEFTLNRTAFRIGGLEVQWYGVIIALGFILALLYGLRKAKKLGLDADRVIDVAIGGMLGGIVGARLYYVAFSWEEFSGDWTSIFRIWDGGLAIYGGLIGAVIVGSLIAKWRKVKLLPMFDLAGMGFLIGQAIGRWGNFFNVEAFGGNTNLPWGMTSPKIEEYLTFNQYRLQSIGMVVEPTAPVHPTFLYESLWCLAGFLILHFYFKHRRFDGELFLMYLGWYGLGRAFIEGLRTDPLTVGNIRISQLLAVLLVLASVIVWIVVRVKIHSSHDPDYLPLYVNTQESKDMLAAAAERIRLSKMKKSERQKLEEENTLSVNVVESDSNPEEPADEASGVTADEDLKPSQDGESDHKEEQE